MAQTTNNLGCNGCMNNYTAKDIFDRFMESDDEMEVCKQCPNLTYAGGIMSCKYLDQMNFVN